MLTLSFSPLIPNWAVWALAAAAIGLAVLAVRARGPVASVRALALALIVAALANPSLVQEERENVKSIVVVVIDRSASNLLEDRAAMTDRVKAELQRRFANMPEMDTRFVEVGDSEGDGTLLFAALRNALADVPPDRVAGVILVTDGVVHDIPAGDAQPGRAGASSQTVPGRH